MATKMDMHYEAPFVSVMTSTSELLVRAISDAVDGLNSLADKAFELVTVWQSRNAQRHHLMELDDRLLHDLGMTRADAIVEARKPFWRA
ncbi:DUF1127 domain-containing protein [Aestuariispira ectoiniformans]|uniref:DUF1127 domain-containing protein n=1 Tax=Aestuariispira ectoiniformans TaxID=2775080 RepID=UPI00223B5E19|nr:DUF1127 domain-containing protein [Aestuariispira ectoiniformans]